MKSAIFFILILLLRITRYTYPDKLPSHVKIFLIIVDLLLNGDIDKDEAKEQNQYTEELKARADNIIGAEIVLSTTEEEDSSKVSQFPSSFFHKVDTSISDANPCSSRTCR
jgi:hypothetical protein